MTAIHPAARVAGVIAVPAGPKSKRVMAVEWEDHDPLTCDGNDLAIDTSDFLDCPVSGCRWTYDPESRCPAHASVS